MVSHVARALALFLLVACSAKSSPVPAVALPAPGSAGPTGPGLSTKAALGDGDAAFCRTCGAPAPSGALRAPELNELSGLVASHVHPEIYFAHNDSGDVPRFFALRPDGTLVATFSVKNATAVDWEDVARGPCGSESCLYFADMGDNKEVRPIYTIYRVREPRTLLPSEQTLAADEMRFVYPDGRHNAETLLVHPKTGSIAIVTKVAGGNSGVYEWSAGFQPDQQVTLVKAGELTPSEGSPRFTGGDVHPDGAGILLRTYSNLFYYALAGGQTMAQALVARPCVVPDADEEQGEAVAFDRSGDGYATVSEGVGAKMNFVSCH